MRGREYLSIFKFIWKRLGQKDFTLGRMRTISLRKYTSLFAGGWGASSGCSPCGVSPRPLLPQESSYISYAKLVHRSSFAFAILVLSQPQPIELILMGACRGILKIFYLSLSSTHVRSFLFNAISITRRNRSPPVKASSGLKWLKATLSKCFPSSGFR